MSSHQFIQERIMRTREKLIQARVSAFEKDGREGLAPHPRRRHPMLNQTPPEPEQRLLAMTQEYPLYSYVKIDNQLKLAGALGLPAYFVRGRLRGWAGSMPRPSSMPHCSCAAAKRHLSMLPVTAVDLLHDRVLPHYEATGMSLELVLTDHGRLDCGRPLRHPCKLCLTVHRMEHRKTNRCIRRRPTASASALTAPPRKSFFRTWLSEETLQSQSASCRRIWTASSTATTRSGATRATAPRAGSRRRPLPTAWRWPRCPRPMK